MPISAYLFTRESIDAYPIYAFRFVFDCYGSVHFDLCFDLMDLLQMLSMRNGVYRPSVNLPGPPEHLPTSQMCAALNQNSVDASSNPPAAMLPMNHFLGAMSGSRHPFGPPNQDRPRHDPLVLSSVPCTITREPPFLLGTSQESHLRSLQLTVSAEMIFQEEAMLKQRLSSTQETTSLPAHEMKPVRQEAGHFDTSSIWKNQSQDMLPSNPESALFVPHLRRFQNSNADSGLRAESK